MDCVVIWSDAWFEGGEGVDLSKVWGGGDTDGLLRRVDDVVAG